MRDGDLRSIGEVLNLLQAEFDDITISKIRFLEAQGLVEPTRTPSGYRMFGDSDIKRLRWILRMQREQFLPLKVIKARIESGRVAELDADAELEAAPRFDMAPNTASRTFDELASESGLAKTDLAKLVDAGVIIAKKRRGSATYDDDALKVASAAADLLEAGLDVRHLRSYKVAAEREAGILEQLLAPVAHQRGGENRDETLTSLGLLVGQGEQLRRALIRSSLRGSLVQ